MKLFELCQNTEYTCLQGKLTREVAGIAYDSRKAEAHFLFVCLVGGQSDGHRYISDAIKNGADVIVTERIPEEKLPETITVLQMKSTRKGLAQLSAAFFGYPAKRLTTIGITGTKGKTTTSFMIKSMLEQAGKKVGLIGTLGAFIGETAVPQKNTTPESWEIQRLLRAMADEGCEYAVMEVSSQGLKQHRTDAITFDYGIFTNLSPDHIGPLEHESFEEYILCKSRLFSQCKTGIVNADDCYRTEVTKGHTCDIVSYSILTQSNLKAEAVDYLDEEDGLGMHFTTCGCLTVYAKVFIPGTFSVYNALAAMLCCHLCGVRKEAILPGLSRAKVCGRAELVTVSKDFSVVIDYAHNEASTDGILEALQKYRPNRLICLFGCGGNRPKIRRFAMGEAAGRRADLCVLTCDNPRDEALCDINTDIKEGLFSVKHSRYIEIDDREKAIYYCLDHAQKGDIIVLLGKGHETYQEIKGVKYHFDEREVLAKWKENHINPPH